MWYLAGREPGPQIAISSPQGFVGQKGALAFTIDTPDGRVSALNAVIEQNGQQTSLAPEGGVAVRNRTRRCRSRSARRHNPPS